MSSRRRPRSDVPLAPPRAIDRGLSNWTSPQRSDGTKSVSLAGRGTIPVPKGWVILESGQRRAPLERRDVGILGAMAAITALVAGSAVAAQRQTDEVVVAAPPVTVAGVLVTAPSTVASVPTTRPPIPTTTAAATTVPPSTAPPGPGVPLRFVAADGAGDATFTALADGSAQVGFVFSSQGRVDVADLVVLDDDRSLQVAQYLLPIGRADRLGDIERNTLDAVSSSLTTAELRAMNREVEAGSSMQTVVDRWLIDNGFDSAFPPATGALTIGSVDFPEVELVSRIYGGALGFKGKQVTVRAGLGSRALVAPLLSTGDIDLMVEYSGAYLTLLGGTPTADVTAAMADLRTRLVPLGLWAGDPSLAQDTDAIAVPRAVAERYGLAEVSDLAFVPEPLVLVGPPDCPTRPTCLPGLRERYGIVIDG